MQSRIYHQATSSASLPTCVHSHGPRQAPEQGEQGCAQPEERRRRHHEQQVLHHVDLEQQVGERLDRRGQGQVDGREPAEERGGASAVPAPGVEMASQVLDITRRMRADWVVGHLFGNAPSVSIKELKKNGFTLVEQLDQREAVLLHYHSL